MRRTLLKIAVFVLTLGLGVGISLGWNLYQWSLVPYEISPTPPWPLATKTPPRPQAADEIMIVGGIDACGRDANFHTMELSDGTTISQTYETFSSPPAAARALKTRLIHAEIAERIVERDDKGRITVETILTASPRVMRIRIYGKNLSVINAPSLKHLQLYESGALYRGPKIPGDD